MHTLLRSEHGLITAYSPSAESDHADPQIARAGAMGGRHRLYFFAAAAVFAFVAIGIGYIATHRSGPPFRGAEMAQITKAVGARFAYGTDGETVPAAGTAIRQGIYELQDGLIEVEFPSGVALVGRAPMTVDFVDGSCVRLIDGQLTAHVPKSAIGFRVEAPGATVIDQGTDFGVEAIKDRESEVHVFNGEVLIDLHGDKVKSADLLRLVTGEAARVDYSTGMPSGIDLDAQKFIRSLNNDASAYARAVLQFTPAVYFRMEPSGDGTKLMDASESGADAAIHFGRSSDPVWTTGKVGSALRLGGPAQQTYASVAAYPQATGDTLSVVAWVYAQSRPRWASIAKNWAGGPDDRGQFHFGLSFDTGELEAHIVDSSGAEIAVRDKIPLPLNTWHHVAFVADGKKLRLYRNGVELNSRPYRMLHRDSRIKSLGIGTKLNLRGDAPEERDFNMWDGKLDELAIFNHALSAEQIMKLFQLANDKD
jgi:hypothetical protein